MELALKNCRVLQFKLKKAEKTLAETNYQKETLEKRWNQEQQQQQLSTSAARRDNFRALSSPAHSFGRSGSVDSGCSAAMDHERLLKDYQVGTGAISKLLLYKLGGNGFQVKLGHSRTLLSASPTSASSCRRRRRPART